MQTIYDFIRKCNLYYLATMEGDQPRVRPFHAIDLFEGRLYIQTSRTKAVARQIEENPKVELCCFDGEKCLRLEGTLEEDDRAACRQHMLGSYPDLKTLFKVDDTNHVSYFFSSGKATFTSHATLLEVIEF